MLSIVRTVISAEPTTNQNWQQQNRILFCQSENSIFQNSIRFCQNCIRFCQNCIRFCQNCIRFCQNSIRFC